MQAKTPFHDILVGIDSHGLATDAALQGLRLSTALGSRLRFVHAVDLPTSLPEMRGDQLTLLQANLQVRSREAALETLRDAVKTTPFEKQDLDALLEVRLGHPAQVVLQEAETDACDLIVLGPHGAGTAADFGSTVRAVLSRATVPVWAQLGKAEPIQKILAAVDFSEHGERALELARDLARKLDATLHALHVFTPPPAALSGVFADAFPGPRTFPSWQEETERNELQRRVAELAKEGVKVESETIEGVAQDVIAERSSSFDLVVMGTHGRTGLSRFLLGSVTMAVLRKAKCPVLAVPSPKTSWLLPEHEEIEAARK